VPGKPRVFLPYVAGWTPTGPPATRWRRKGLPRLHLLAGPGGSQCNDGVIRRLQPDVAMMLELMAPFSCRRWIDAGPKTPGRSSQAMEAVRPPGPEVGEIVIDGVLPGAAGDLEYRLYRPASPGPHPIVAYFHGAAGCSASQGLR
jgi:acetyl esterase/lipase